MYKDSGSTCCFTFLRANRNAHSRLHEQSQQPAQVVNIRKLQAMRHEDRLDGLFPCLLGVKTEVFQIGARQWVLCSG